MRAWLGIALLVIVAGASAARPTIFAWDIDPGWPAATTVELCGNADVCREILATAGAGTLDLPVAPGDVIAGRARAKAPDGRVSDWSTVAQTWPRAPSGVWATREQDVMAAPTFVAQYATAFNSTTSPKTAMSAVAVSAGDVLIGLVTAEGNDGSQHLGITENGAGSWTPLQSYTVTDYTEVRVDAYTVPGDETITVTVTTSLGIHRFGSNVVRFSGSDGVGASAKAQGSTGSPSVSITTTQNNSAIVAICGDWNAVSGTQTFTFGGSSTGWTALTGYPGDATSYGIAIAYIGDAGAAGAKSVAMSAPSGQKWSIIAVEVKGSAGAAATSLPPQFIQPNFIAQLVR